MNESVKNRAACVRHKGTPADDRRFLELSPVLRALRAGVRWRRDRQPDNAWWIPPGRPLARHL
jgi:hypothetical protein